MLIQRRPVFFYSPMYRLTCIKSVFLSHIQSAYQWVSKDDSLNKAGTAIG